MPEDSSRTSLLGREYELRRLGGLIEGVLDRGGAMVVRGEVGIGKSALLAETGRIATVRGMRILATAGVESEAQLAFAGLHRLLRPLLAQVNGLPDPQRDAALVAFGMATGAAPDLFLIGLATLSLVGEAATQAPVLLLVEDAHWLDRASADVLAFVARRLEFEPAVLVAATRDGFHGPFDDAGLAELHVDRLDAVAAGTLLDVQAPDLSPAVRARVLREAAGNPLALVELPIAMSQIDERECPSAWLPLTTRLERAFAARVSDLDTATRTLLLVAALNDAGSDPPGAGGGPVRGGVRRRCPAQPARGGGRRPGAARRRRDGPLSRGRGHGS